MIAIVGALTLTLAIDAQPPSAPPAVASQCGSGAASGAARYPFAIGERLTYRVSFGVLRVGHGSTELTADARDTVRGRGTYHAAFRIDAGTWFFRVHDEIDSWFDPLTLSTLRFTQNIREGGYRANRRFEVYPERARYVQLGAGDTAKVSVPAPLDDGSFLYFLRTLPLTVGSEYVCRRYFQPEANPVVIRVVRAERITVPAGTFDAVVLQPLIKSEGIFSEHGRAEVWIRADGAHEMLQMKSHLVFGSINLYLTGISSGGTSPR